MLKAGERVGDWIIDRPLGEGGMGAVYRVHSALSERVDAALKVMKPSMEADARARFVREAEALSALNHPAIIRVMGFSEDPRRGLLYLVMDLADGETLKRRLERGPLALPEALATFVPLAGGLEHAHAAGIFHRDLKPSNVILSPEGVRLVDFGIAAAENTGDLTGAGHIGTLGYLPPEVFRGERAEPRMIDVYGFGLLLNEALTGVHPFALEPGLTPAAAMATVGMRKLQQPALDPGEGMPQPIRALVRRATDPTPAQRPDMAEIRRVLASLVERRTGGAAAGPVAGAVAGAVAGPAPPARVPAWTPPADATMRVPDPVLPPGSVPMRDGTTSHRRRRWRERRRIVIVAWVASMVAAALMAALIILMVRGSGGGAAVPESSPSPTAPPAAAPATVPLATPRRAPRSPAAASPSSTPSPRASATAPPPPSTPPPSVEAPTAPSPRVSISPRVLPSPPAGAVVRPTTPAPPPSPVSTPPPPEEEEEPEPSPSPVTSPSPPVSAPGAAAGDDDRRP